MTPAPTLTAGQYLDSDSGSNSSYQKMLDFDSGSDSSYQKMLDSGSDSDSKFAKNGVDSRHDSDSGVGIAHLWSSMKLYKIVTINIPILPILSGTFASKS